MTLLFTLTLTVLLQWNTRLFFFFFTAALFTSLTPNALFTIWCSGQTALFLSLLAKAALAYHSATKPAPFCKLFAGLYNTNKSPTSLRFSSCLTLATLSSPQSFLLPQTLWKIWQGPSSLSCSIRLQWVPGYSFLRRNDKADKLARQGALLVPCVITCSLSPVISRIHPRLFADWRHTVSSEFFDTHVLSISTEEFVLLCHARCVLSRLRCKGHSLLLSSYQFKSGRIANFSCSACGNSSQDTSHLILHCSATDSLHCSLLGDLWYKPLRVAWLLRLHGLPPCPHTSEGIR